jgi:hypothetical protein
MQLAIIRSVSPRKYGALPKLWFSKKRQFWRYHRAELQPEDRLVSAVDLKTQALAEEVEYWFNMLEAARRRLMNYRVEVINPVTGMLKDGIPKWKWKMDEALLQADYHEAQRNFNNASVAHGNEVRRRMNGDGLKQAKVAT